MEVILLERVAKLGQMGEVVRVKDGFARNYLLPKGKALRATQANKTKFETMKVELQARNLEAKGEADKVGAKLDGQSFVVLRQASETGQLYGSVSPRDLAALLTDGGFAVDRNQIALNVPIKTIGLHKVPVLLHPEVEVTITVNVARSADEAERLARGEDVTVRREEGEDEEQAEAALAAAEAFFEPEAPPRRGGRGRQRADRGGAERRPDAAAARQSKMSNCFGGGGAGGGSGGGGGTTAVFCRPGAAAPATLRLLLWRSARPARRRDAGVRPERRRALRALPRSGRGRRARRPVRLGCAPSACAPRSASGALGSFDQIGWRVPPRSRGCWCSARAGSPRGCPGSGPWPGPAGPCGSPPPVQSEANSCGAGLALKFSPRELPTRPAPGPASCARQAPESTDNTPQRSAAGLSAGPDASFPTTATSLSSAMSPAASSDSGL